MSDKLTFIDLFAGCGGLSEGFLMSGQYDGLAHVEWELPMVRTLRKRLHRKWAHTTDESLKQVVHFDIQKTDELINGSWSEETKAVYGKTNHSYTAEKGLKGISADRNVDLVIGGPPCQAYSIAGRAQDKDSMKYDYRNYLFESFTAVVKAFQPRLFLFENVPGMLSACPGGIPVTERIYEAFEAIGYDILKPDELHTAVFAASDYGVAQKRRRVILCGVKKTDKAMDLSLLYKTLKAAAYTKSSPPGAGTVLSDFPEFRPAASPYKHNGRKMAYEPVSSSLETLTDCRIPRFQNARDIKIFREWVEKGMNAWSSEEKINYYNNLMGKSSRHAKYRNLEWDKPSPTVVAHLYKDGLMFIHPDSKQARSITVREAAALQSFPDDYPFEESMGYNYKMIGNAVPPLMAKSFATALSEILER